MLFNKNSVLVLFVTGVALATAQESELPPCLTTCQDTLDKDVAKCGDSPANYDIVCACPYLAADSFIKCLKKECSKSEFSLLQSFYDEMCKSSGGPTVTPTSSDTKPHLTIISSDSSVTPTSSDTKPHLSIISSDSSTDTAHHTGAIKPSDSTTDTAKSTPTDKVSISKVTPTPSGTTVMTIQPNTTMSTIFSKMPSKTATAQPTIETSTGGAEGAYTGIHGGLFAAFAAAAVMFML